MRLELLTSLPGHSEPAWSVAFNPTRPILASCSTDRTVRLYQYHLESDPPRVEYLKTISTQHKKSVRSISWAPSGKTLATGSFDSSVAVWEEVDPDAEEEEGEEGVYRPNGDEGEGEGGDKEKEWECVTTLEGHESECKSVAFSSDGALLASCSRDKSVWVWEVQPDSDFECIAVMMEHGQDVKSLAWHPHEEILASASYDSHIHLMYDDPDSDWLCFQKLHAKLPQTPISFPSSSSPSLDLVTALFPSQEERDADQSIDLPPLEEDETVWSLAWAPGGEYLASGGDDGGIRLWTRQGRQPESSFTESIHTSAHTGPCFSLSWTAGGISEDQGGKGLLASGGADGRIIIWQVKASPTLEGDAKTQAGVEIYPVGAIRHAHGEGDVNGLQWCLREDGKGRGMLASAGDDGSVKVWRFVE